MQNRPVGLARVERRNKMDTKSLFVDVASKLFYEKGYMSVGVAEIIQATNTSKGSFYHHFPEGKEQLLLTCLERLQMNVMNDMQLHFQDAETFQSALSAIFDRLIQMFEETGQIEGYSFTSIVSAIGAVSEKVREVCANLYVLMEQEFATQLHKRGFSLDEAKMKAAFLTAAIEGSIMLTVIKKTADPLRNSSEQLGLLFN